MKIIVNIFALFILTSIVKGQAFDKIFTGELDKTFWKFEFRKDGVYKRVSRGQAGNRVLTGMYKVYNDTLELVSGLDGLSGINKYYLISSHQTQFSTIPKGRIIDLGTLYEFYGNEHNYPSRKNKIVNVEIIDNQGRVVKSFSRYAPINESENQYAIDLNWCVEFCGYPANLKNAYFQKPDIINQEDGLFRINFFDGKERLVSFIYSEEVLNGVGPHRLDLEYFSETKKVKQITDSRDGSIYTISYDKNENISSMDYFTKDKNLISQLKITE